MLLNELHIYKEIFFKSTEEIELRVSEVPVEIGDGTLVDARRKKIAHIFFHKKEYEGGYGILTKGIRTDISGQKTCIMIKEPTQSDSLGSEALIQWYARKTLHTYGLETSIPKVYDIFYKNDAICFSMEFIDGCFPYQFIHEALSPDIVFLQILAQVAILCYLLQKDIFLDHRDLKANNIFIRKKISKYEISTETETFRFQCPFQVVLLDFGFACLGNEKRISKINIAQRALPDIDGCPKIGRDLFHFISSLWSIPTIREKMTSTLQKEVQSWLTYNGKDYSIAVQRYKKTDLAFAVTGAQDFRKTALDSISILRTIHEKFPSVLKTL